MNNFTPMAISLFTAIDERTSDVINTRVILIDPSIIKVDSQQIHSDDLKIVFDSFVESNMSLDYPEICCCRYDISDLKFLLHLNLTDKQEVARNLISYLTNLNIPAKEIITRSEYLSKLETSKKKEIGDLYDITTEENIEALLITNREDIIATALIVNRLLRNPYEHFNNSQGIIKALKQTTYYLESKIIETGDLRQIKKIEKLHILVAKLRNNRKRCQVFYDLYKFQQVDAPYVNLILSYKHNENVTEKQIEILVDTKWDDLDTYLDPLRIINALKKTTYYQNKIKSDQITSLGPNKYHLLLAELKRHYGGNASFTTSQECSRCLDGEYDKHVITLELLKSRQFKGEKRKTKINEIRRFISKHDLYPEFKQELVAGLDNLRGNKCSRLKTTKLAVFSIRIENCKDILGNIHNLCEKHNQYYGTVFKENIIVGNIGAIDNREDLENVFLKLHEKTKIDFPLFKTTLYYNFSMKPIIKSFIDDYLIGMGYKSQPFISFFDDQNGELNILTLNIRATAPFSPICAVMNHPRAMKVISVLEIKYNLSQHLVDKSIMDNIDKLLSEETSATLKEKNSGPYLKK